MGGEPRAAGRARLPHHDPGRRGAAHRPLGRARARARLRRPARRALPLRRHARRRRHAPARRHRLAGDRGSRPRPARADVLRARARDPDLGRRAVGGRVRRRLPGALRRPAAFGEARATLESIAKLGVRTVIPGHGRVFTDVARALERSFYRLDGYEEDVTRHARHCVKVLLVFALLEKRRMAVADLPRYCEEVGLLRELNARHLHMSAAAARRMARRRARARPRDRPRRRRHRAAGAGMSAPAGNALEVLRRVPAPRADLVRRPDRAPRLLPRRVRRAAEVARRADLRRPRRALPVPARSGLEPGRDGDRDRARRACPARSRRGSASRCLRRWR